MEENVPLEPHLKNKLQKTISGIQKLLKTGKITPPLQKKLDEKKSKGPSNGNKGVVYIGHIPHGFYENEMRGYFSQFGKVTNVRVARSSKTGNSKGYGFIEFADRDVADIVAETMNNYLMDKRLLKAEVIPAERQMPNLFKGNPWLEKSKCPGVKNQRKAVGKYNRKITDQQWIEESKKHLDRIYKTQRKLKNLGIDFDFTPSDIPEELKDYDPSNKQNNIKKNTKEDKLNIDTSDSDLSESEEEVVVPKQNNKKKGKSMKKPFSLLLQPPKAKVSKKNNIGVVAPSKIKKNSVKSENIMQNIVKEKLANKKQSKIEDKNILKKKDFGGITKKKDKLPLSKDRNKGKINIPMEDLMKSDLVKVVKKNKNTVVAENKNGKKKK